MQTEYYKIATKLKDIVGQNRVIVKKDAVLVFVCGAAPNPENPNARDAFITYARRHLESFDFFLAEDYFGRLTDPNEKDLLSIENDIARFADCLMVFAESESAFAELGAFAHDDQLAEIMLVVNEKRFSGVPSFINQGPIAKIDKVSKFGAAIFTRLDMVLSSVSEIEQRLQVIERKRGYRLPFHDLLSFQKSTRKHRMLFLYELICLFEPVSLREIIHLLEVVFSAKGYEVRPELTVLQTINLISFDGQYYVNNARPFQRYLIFLGLDVKRARATIIRSLRKHDRPRFRVLSSRSDSEEKWVS